MRRLSTCCSEPWDGTPDGDALDVLDDDVKAMVHPGRWAQPWSCSRRARQRPTDELRLVHRGREGPMTDAHACG